MKDVETQKSAMSNVTIDDASDRRLREEVETLRRELTKASQAIERASRNEEAAQLRVSELETILQEVRTESAENLANLKAMYMDEQNAMLNDRVNEARKESTGAAKATLLLGACPGNGNACECSKGGAAQGMGTKFGART